MGQHEKSAIRQYEQNEDDVRNISSRPNPTYPSFLVGSRDGVKHRDIYNNFLPPYLVTWTVSPVSFVPQSQTIKTSPVST